MYRGAKAFIKEQVGVIGGRNGRGCKYGRKNGGKAEEEFTVVQSRLLRSKVELTKAGWRVSANVSE